MSAHASHTSALLPTRLVADVTLLSPTTVWRWRRCRRLYLLRNVLQLPSVDDSPWTDEGLKVHAVLRQLHEQGRCEDQRSRQEFVEMYAGSATERLRGFLDRHADRCPRGAEPAGHEVALSRYQSQAPPFVVTASIDAVWIHDKLLDARDYKTGTEVIADLSQDLRARVQAWLLAPMAEKRGLRLRMRYEFLAPEVTDDPPAWEPDAEELASIGRDLQAMSEEMRTEREFVGVGDPAVCRTCEYRSICVDARLEEPTTA